MNQSNSFKRKLDKYIKPKTRYRYSRMRWSDYITGRYNGYRTTRSSIIPVTTINNKTYWLLGSFWDFPRDILTDFGGDCNQWFPPAEKGKPRPRDQERNRQAPFGCAMIELHEESKGLLDKLVLKSLGSLDNKDIYIYEGIDNRKRERVIFTFVPLKYENIKNIPNEFERLPNPSNERFGPIDFYLEEDILDKRVTTSRNLTDFVDYLTGN